MIGVAGGVAAKAKTNRRSGMLPGGRGPRLPKIAKPDVGKAVKGINVPKPNGSAIDWVEQRAREVGNASYKVAELAAEARDVRNSLSGD